MTHCIHILQKLELAGITAITESRKFEY